MALLNINDITISFGSNPLLDSINMQIHEGEKICLLGRNGSGKSTFMKLINGEIEPDSGTVIRHTGLRTALLTQDVPDDLTGSIYDVVSAGVQGIHDHHSHDEKKARQQIEKTLSLLSLDPDLLFENLSAGMKRRVLLGQALACDPDILLLDEPTNHLDMDTVKWLEEFLVRYDKTVFFVTHDRAFLQRIAGRIIELDRGNLFDWKCSYRIFLERKEAWLDSEEAKNNLFDKRLAAEETWIRKGIKARRTRNEGRVRALKKMRSERSDRRELQGTVKMQLNKSENSGKVVIESENTSFGYDENILINNFSSTILRGDRIGIIGPNGCGKSTLIKILLGDLTPSQGEVRTGTRLETAYFDQLRDQIDDSLTVKENVTDGNEIIHFNGKSKHVIGYLQDFLFTPDRADEKAEVLSGGEKNRMMLARMFTRPSNLIIKDETTNELDIETIELLEELLSEYQGTLLIISHDREFLNNVATGIYAFEGDGQIGEYAGGYDDWLIQRKTEVQPERKEKKTPREKKPRPKFKLSFNEKKELQSIPELIEKGEQRKQEIIQQMSDPSFYQNSGPEVADVKRELEELEKSMEELFDRWSELEEIDNLDPSK